MGSLLHNCIQFQECFSQVFPLEGHPQGRAACQAVLPTHARAPLLKSALLCMSLPTSWCSLICGGWSICKVLLVVCQAGQFAPLIFPTNEMKPFCVYLKPEKRKYVFSVIWRICSSFWFSLILKTKPWRLKVSSSLGLPGICRSLEVGLL